MALEMSTNAKWPRLHKQRVGVGVARQKTGRCPYCATLDYALKPDIAQCLAEGMIMTMIMMRMMRRRRATL